ncbi:hypothetical protein N0V83_000933 [Neocucurbitaria cava]|uniref:Uncharacterized protein n=1 Tax=Neocucurbitaria cava TaxID=798079 RepID=A0A9W8YIR5_9PLEO|nr:hypothetical protein N0V83_000933 [Neocucurbitaria cava]
MDMLPSAEELKGSKIDIEVSPGVVKRIPAAEGLKREVERYLPPSGRYYDQNTVEAIFASSIFAGRGRCVSCWSPKHVLSMRRCKRQCCVCGTEEHLGLECPALYATWRWWREHGHTPSPAIQSRPTTAQLAYLIVAKVVKPIENIQGPLIVNMDHPAVREFYQGKAAPEVILSQPKEPEVDTDARVHPNTSNHDHPDLAHRHCLDHIRQLENKIGAMENRIQSMESTLNIVLDAIRDTILDQTHKNEERLTALEYTLGMGEVKTSEERRSLEDDADD